MLEPEPNSPAGFQRARSMLTQSILSATHWVDSHSLLSLAALLLIFILSDLGNSLATPMGHDELFTFYIAQAKSLHELFTQISVIDLNPPLSYLLTRASFHFFGVGTLQCRLPEMAGFALALTGIFFFVRRRAGPSFGLLAAAFLFASRAGDLNILARPYGLMLGFTALALVAWQQSSESNATWSTVAANFLLGFAIVALFLSHVFGLMAWAAILCGEVAQIARQRRVHVARALALLLPLAAVVAYRPLIQNHGLSLFPVAFQPGGEDIFNFYMQHIDRELITLWLTALLVVLIAGRTWLRGSLRFALTEPEWVAIIAFMVAPLALILHLMLAHGAFFDRYAVIACIGTAIFFAVFLAWWCSSRSSVAIIAAILALTISSRTVVAIVSIPQVFRHTEPTAVPSHLDALPDATLPLVDASGLTFVEMQRREPSALLDHTFYITGGPFAIQYAHATIFEGMQWERDNFHFASHVDSYTPFVLKHPHFYVFGTFDYPEDWLLRKLMADGARIDRIRTLDTSYKDHELYEVTITPK